MPRPVRALTVVSNWDCAGCSNCCRTYVVHVNATEKARIEAMDWSADPELKDVLPIVHDRKAGGDRLNHDADGTCVFLGPDNRCKIHGRFGSAAKPLACRLFPFLLVPAGDHWRVGLRFACPTVVKDAGRPVAEHADDLEEYAELYEAEIGRDIATDPPPELQPGQTTTWPDLLRFAQTASTLLAGPGTLEWKLRTVLAYVAMMRKSRFEKVAGGKLGEFLEIVAEAVKEETPVDPAAVPRPGFVGRSLFRQVAAVYSRKDVGQDHGDLVARGALGRMAAAWRFAVGRGAVPTVHAAIPTTATFEQCDRPMPLPESSTDQLIRYFRTKLESLQFCGRSLFGLPVWDGLESLILAYPVTIWLARALAQTPMPAERAIATALRIVDDNFGFNPLLGSWKQKLMMSLFRQKDELPKLVAACGN
jgi:lysine-N-methylase